MEPRCHVCQSKLRVLIDRMSVEGYRPAYIAKYVQQAEPELSRHSIERHLVRHVNYHDTALREILDQRAKEQGILNDEARGNILTRQAVLDQFIKRTWDRLTDPSAKVPFEVGLQALQLQETFEREQEQAVIDQVTRQLQAIIQSIREIVPIEYHEAVAKRAEYLYDEPVLAEILPPPTVPDIEIDPEGE